MHSDRIDAWKHTHDFLPSRTAHRERRTRIVVALTLVTMVVEIGAGSWFGSMALLADGWHMASHAAAIGAAALAYVFARRHSQDQEYTFGTGKMLPLAGFGSAVALGVVALTMGAESMERLLTGDAVRAFIDECRVAVLLATHGRAGARSPARLVSERGVWRNVFEFAGWLTVSSGAAGRR